MPVSSSFFGSPKSPIWNVSNLESIQRCCVLNMAKCMKIHLDYSVFLLYCYCDWDTFCFSVRVIEFFFFHWFDHQIQLNKVQIGVGRVSVMQTGFIHKFNSVKCLQCWIRWRLICIEINYSIGQCLFNNATTHRVFDTHWTNTATLSF